MVRSVCSGRPGAVCAGAWAPLGAISEGRGGGGKCAVERGEISGVVGGIGVWGGGEVGAEWASPPSPAARAAGRGDVGGCSACRCRLYARLGVMKVRVCKTRTDPQKS